MLELLKVMSKEILNVAPPPAVSGWLTDHISAQARDIVCFD